ncbi:MULTISPECIES: cell envelope integrity TolA C-terminal domain-containing protein [Lelliottia]|uniref:Cell envelope integrity protein TolA n=1 Tax=Lelliottia aquatilis TaxID=2080838 RepID=A0ABX4ZVN5_9ENTR|nr:MULTISPECIES: cell envelope integrity TolA C-terminal domain-containing protein [Lelliottia]NTZ48000.1 hypothetical protein [Lelliottia aquatilis]POZ19724.1 hypothetical protein C3712_21500 [Lelliottia aquatilis]POZ24711.1 hypothetical protein C3708_13445 [Lelliottia sp. 7254-16]POZ25570.1 hypothetical protein C3711_13150 [Lelliottia aquatilis]POZ32923.1 hypothetical protein C3710_09175 [Lelliottia aquatilis]
MSSGKIDSKMKTVINYLLIAGVVLLTGCTKTVASTEDKAVDDLFNNVAPANDATPGAYAAKIQHAVSTALPEMQRYRGQSCSVHLRLSPDAKLLTAAIEKGDQPLCEEVLNAIKKITFPPFPNQDVEKVFTSFMMDFKP